MRAMATDHEVSDPREGSDSGPDALFMRSRSRCAWGSSPLQRTGSDSAARCRQSVCCRPDLSRSAEVESADHQLAARAAPSLAENVRSEEKTSPEDSAPTGEARREESIWSSIGAARVSQDCQRLDDDQRGAPKAEKAHRLGRLSRPSLGVPALHPL